MIVDQISVFIENKLGTLAEVTEVIGAAGIDLRALSLADTAEFGVLRLIVSDPDSANRLLREAGFAVAVTKTLAVSIPDVPGGLAKVLRILTENQVTVEYAYASITRNENNAYVILRVDDNEQAQKLLAENGVNMTADKNLFSN
ncbi:ACT domain-containing protein [Synergistaceae bacterium OttesenSCG-928-I11]|nr:ACT domain-containing protein [Synergistaceae bacterium OttesenSCG-928-I11]